MKILCHTCGTKTIRIKTEKTERKAMEQLGIPFLGTYVCLKCYPEKNPKLKSQKLLYEVHYRDEDTKTWQKAGLDMCHGNILCDKCKKAGKASDSCDYIHTQTEDRQVAEDKLKMLQKECVAKIVTIKHSEAK